MCKWVGKKSRDVGQQVESTAREEARRGYQT